MPTFRLNITSKQRGVLFDAGATKAAATRATIAANEALALEAVARVQARLDQVLRNPTGYYRSRVTVDRKAVARFVTDSGVIYGGWLEGVARNNKTSRFKGYRTFRKVQDEMRRDKERIAAPAIARLAKELRG